MAQFVSGINLLVLFLAGCIVLGLWGPKQARWRKWAVPVGAAVLVLFLIATHYHRV